MLVTVMLPDPVSKIKDADANDYEEDQADGVGTLGTLVRLYMAGDIQRLQ